MRRTYIVCLLAWSLSGIQPVVAVSLNPLDWFRSEPEDFSEPTLEEVARAETLYEEAFQAMEAGKPKRALSRWEEIVDDYGNTPQAADALYNKGRLLKDSGTPKAAFETFQTLLNRYPGYEKFDAVIEAQYEIAVSYMEGERGRFLFLFPGFKEPRTAIEYFEIIINNAPYSSYAPTSLMNIALISESIDDKELAIDALDRLITFYPRSVLTSDAYFTMAQVFASLIDGPYYDQGTTMEAMNYYEDFLILFPQSAYVESAEEGLAQVRDIHARSKLVLGEYFYVHAKNDDAARIYFNEAITVAPDSEAAEFAKKRLERIEAGESRPMFSEKVTEGSLYESVQSFFDERWKMYDAEEAAAREAKRVRDRQVF